MPRQNLHALWAASAARRPLFICYSLQPGRCLWVSCPERWNAASVSPFPIAARAKFHLSHFSHTASDLLCARRAKHAKRVESVPLIRIMRWLECTRRRSQPTLGWPSECGLDLRKERVDPLRIPCVCPSLIDRLAWTVGGPEEGDSGLGNLGTLGPRRLALAISPAICIYRQMGRPRISGSLASARRGKSHATGCRRSCVGFDD